MRLKPLTGEDITREWQRCDLFGDGPQTMITVRLWNVSEMDPDIDYLEVCPRLPVADNEGDQ